MSPTLQGEMVWATGSVHADDGGLRLEPSGPAIDSPYVLSLLGADLPEAGQRVRVAGRLVGRDLHASRWRVEPDGTSAWAREVPADVTGTDVATARSIGDSVPEHWPIVSIGQSRTVADRLAVVLEVESATPEVEAWHARQPPGSVWLIRFLRPAEVSAP